MTADEILVARRAGAMCIYAGRHGDFAEWPCDHHLALARWLLGVPSSAVAPTSFSVAPQPCAEEVDGAAGLLESGIPSTAKSQAGGSVPQTDNRPGLLTPRAAYRPNVLGQKQV